jgi:lactate permease
LLMTGWVRQQEGLAQVSLGGVRTNYLIAVPSLDRRILRDTRLHAFSPEPAAGNLLASSGPLEAVVNVVLVDRYAARSERAEFNLAWLTSPGSGVFMAAVLSIIMFRMTGLQIRRVLSQTGKQMRVPIPTIACMLGLSYVSRYAGMDATLGIAFAATGWLYPFFAALLGWLGVFLTGTDAGSNALFGSLQKITATEVWRSGVFFHLNQLQAQILICTANSTGGVMGKMIDAQSICVATAATQQQGNEAEIFKAVLPHSILLATVIGILTLVQAYVYPLTRLVP